MTNQSSPAVGVGDRPASEPAPGAGQPKPARSDLESAVFAVREYGQQCTTEFARDFWAGVADRLQAAST